MPQSDDIPYSPPSLIPHHHHPHLPPPKAGASVHNSSSSNNSSSSSSSLEEFIAYVTCRSDTRREHSRDVSLLGSHLFNCGGTRSTGTGNYEPLLTTTTSTTTSSRTKKKEKKKTMQRASVARRSGSDHPTMSPGLRSRSSERHVDIDNHSNNHDHLPPQQQQLQGTESVEGGNHNQLHRAMSDPFDTPGAVDDGGDCGIDGGIDDGDHDYDEGTDEFILAASTSQMTIQPPPTNNNGSNHTFLQIPTFARYPCLENKNKNCWSEPPITIFSVRGMNYHTNQKKVPSLPYLLRSRGSDIFLTDPKKTFSLDAITNSILGGQLLKLPTLAIVFRFPWGYMNLYFEIPTKFSKYINDGSTINSSTTTNMDSSFGIAEQVFAKWLMGDIAYKNERLKLIPYVAEGPWVVRNMVTGRPAIIGKKLPVTYQFTPASSDGKSSPLLMATLDIGNSSATAKRIVSVCRRYMSALTVDIGFVIQGDRPEELPEQMLGAMRIHGPDPLKAPKLN